MARQSPAQKLNRLVKAITAWERLRPKRAYAGITLAAFKRAIQPSRDTRVVIADLQKRLREAIEARDLADYHSFRLLRRLAHGVLADADEGDDSELYAALGYVRASARRPRRRRKTVSRGAMKARV